MPEQVSDRSHPRPLWSGSLTFGLVSVAVALFPAVRGARTSLRMLSPDGTPLRRRYICPREGRPIEPDEIVRGYEVEKGRFVVLTDGELAALDPQKSREIDLQRFVPLDQIDPIYLDRAYFMVADGDSSKAYRLLAETLQATERAGIATFVMRAKAYLVGIWAQDGLMRAQTLRFVDEIRTPADVGLPEALSAPDALVDALRTEIRAAAGDDITTGDLKDEDDAQLRRLILRKKAAGNGIVRTAAKASANEGARVIDLMEMLKRSVEGEAADEVVSAGGHRSRKVPQSSADALGNESKNALYARAKALGLPGRGSMNKQQLIEALRNTGKAK